MTAEPEDLLEDLLAVIHRDGGHYADTYGLDKATKDAALIVIELFQYKDRALDAEAHLREANRHNDAWGARFEWEGTDADPLVQALEGKTPPACKWPFPTPVSNGNTVVWSRLDDPDSWEPGHD